MLGLSPLTRGKPHHQGHVRPTPGLIPARAGKTGAPGNRAFKGRAHPHSRGENSTCKSFVLNVSGSSPLTRGKPQGWIQVSPGRGLIPAHARKTWFRRPCRSDRPAHPRSRRENKQLLVTAASQRGSSPLTRGKHRAVRRAGRQRGLIPARAGKTPKVLWRRLPRWAHPPHAGKTGRTTATKLPSGAHPRSHRENEKCTVKGVRQMGSSPLTRGKNIAPLPNLGAMGSSPLTRGQLLDLATGTRDRGLIPAHAGKTTCCQRAKPLEWAHPRSREDNIFIVTPWGQGEGSSLLTRGKPCG